MTILRLVRLDYVLKIHAVFLFSISNNELFSNVRKTKHTHILVIRGQSSFCLFETFFFQHGKSSFYTERNLPPNNYMDVLLLLPARTTITLDRVQVRVICICVFKAIIDCQHRTSFIIVFFERVALSFFCCCFLLAIIMMMIHIE